MLDDVSFTVKSGQKIAIIGKTGSGKSTLIQGLLRTLERDYDFREDSYLKIDGFDID